MVSIEMSEAYKLTGARNYQSWMYRAKLMLMRENVWQFVDPSVIPLNPPVPGELENIRLARVNALSIIGLNCREDVHINIRDKTDP